MAAADRFYLTRHGVTRANLERIKVGLRDDPLIEEGERQARELAGRVCDMDVERVWSSPLARCLKTARIICHRCDLPLREDERLREMDVGPWEGLTEDEISARWPEPHRTWKEAPGRLDLAGHEGVASVRDRVVAALQDVLESGEVALCVTHIAPIRVARLHFTGQSLDAYGAMTPLNCHVLEFARGDGGWEVRELDLGLGT